MVQRVLKAQVFANLKQIGSIGQGAVALLGINNQDTREKIPCLVKKLSQLRMFPNAEGKMDLSLVCLLYRSPSPRDGATSRMPSSA